MSITRRVFLRNGALAVVGTAAVPAFLTRAAFSAVDLGTSNKRLVVIFQRGAADGLNIVVPHGEQAYYAMRPSINIPRSAVTRSGWLLRPASGDGGFPAAVEPAASGDRACCGLTRSQPIALRRSGLYGVRHARCQSHRGRLAEPSFAITARAGGQVGVPRHRSGAIPAANSCRA